MVVTILWLLLITFCGVVVSKPADENGNQLPGAADGNVVNMAVNQEAGTVDGQLPDTKSDHGIGDSNPAADGTQGAGEAGSNGEPGPSNEEEKKGEVGADSPSNEGENARVESSNVQGAEIPGDKSQHIPRDNNIDWGIAEEKKQVDVDVDVDLSVLQKVKQQQEEEEQQRAVKQRAEQQEEKQGSEGEHKEQEREEKDGKGEGEREKEEEAHHGGAEQKRDAHDDIGVPEPEHLVHGDDRHGDQHAGEDNPVNAEEVKAENDRQAKIRFQSERDELQGVQPKVLGNVHDGTARKVAEFMKNKQFGPGDVDEAMHGGHHVHEETAKGVPREAQAGDVELAAHGEAGAHDHEKETDTVPLSLDPDELMHAGQGHGHVHEAKAANAAPGAVAPEDTSIKSQDNNTDHKNEHEQKGPIGTEYETIIHDGKHVHEKASGGHKPKNRVRYQDIIDLGLDQELLKGIDLSKLLEQEKKEMEDWHKETEARTGEVDPDLSDEERSASFWQKQVTDLRKSYLEKLYAKVRHISNPDLDTAEWENDDDHVRGLRDPSGVHEGETSLEHEMEMWASTISKGGRRPYKEIKKQWEEAGKEGEKAGEDVGEKKEIEGSQREEDGLREGYSQGNEGEVKGGEEGGVQGGEGAQRGEEDRGDVVQDNEDVGRVLGGTEEKPQHEGEGL